MPPLSSRSSARVLSLSLSQDFGPRLSLPPTTRGCREWSYFPVCRCAVHPTAPACVPSGGRCIPVTWPGKGNTAPSPGWPGAGQQQGLQDPTLPLAGCVAHPLCAAPNSAVKEGPPGTPDLTRKVSLRVDSVWQSAQGGPVRGCCSPPVSEACHLAPLLRTGSPGVVASDPLSWNPSGVPSPGAFVERCWRE